MDIEKLIEDLRGLLKQYGEKISYGELVGAPWPYSRAGDLVWQDPEPYFIEQAATALSTLQAENEKLRAELEQVKAEKAKAIENLSDNLRIAYQSRDAAVEDMTEMIGDIEEIRRGCGVDNADADKAFGGGDIVYYSSIKQAAEQNHITLSGLRKRIINGRIIQGILFEFDE